MYIATIVHVIALHSLIMVRMYVSSADDNQEHMVKDKYI